MGRLADLLEGGRRRRRVAGILAVAFALRCALLLAVDVDPRNDFHFDMTFYEIAALRLADGALLRDFDGTPTAKWSPGYPILLGGTYFLLGNDLVYGKLLNVVLATLGCALVYELGRRLFRPAVGLLAAAIVAVMPGDILYAPLHLSEIAFTTVFTAILVLFVVLDERRPSDRALPWLGFGACVGAALLIRGTAGLFLAVPIAIWWVSRSFGGAARRGAAAALGLALVVAPWTLRNIRVMGAPILISTQQVGMALTFAHSEAADGGYSQRLVTFRDELVEPFAGLANPEREIAEWRFEVSRALAYALQHPLRELALVPRRIFHLYAHDHAAMPWLTPQPARGGPKPPIVSPGCDRALRWLADLAFYALFAAALLGFRRAWTLRRPAALILPFTVVYVTLLHSVLFAGDPRFHAPLIPVFAVLAAGFALRAEVAAPPETRRADREPSGAL